MAIPVGILALAIGSYVLVVRSRAIDVTDHLVERAAHLARLFPAAFVVMGHTHIPTTLAAGNATYVNLGSWAESDGEYRAPRTHLVIHERDGRVEAQFCEWHEGEGPRVRARV